MFKLVLNCQAGQRHSSSGLCVTFVTTLLGMCCRMLRRVCRQRSQDQLGQRSLQVPGKPTAGQQLAASVEGITALTCHGTGPAKLVTIKSSCSDGSCNRRKVKHHDGAQSLAQSICVLCPRHPAQGSLHGAADMSGSRHCTLPAWLQLALCCSSA